jgi:hypothetical protein
MKTLELNLPEAMVARLEQAAERLQLSPEQLVVLSLAEKFAQLDAELQMDPQIKEAAEYVLSKNAELYKRLA